MSDAPHETTPTPPRLAVEGLTVAFGGLRALDGVGFEVADGEIVALIGPNGAGKTTVFNAISGLVRPRAGTIRIGGRPAPASTTRLLRRGVSRTLQGLGLYAGMTVLEQVLVPLAGVRAARGSERERAMTMLAELGMDADAHRPADALPYPERKRVALARALVTRPSLLLLDEPAGGLGGADMAQLAEAVRRVSAGGCAVLLVEHHVDFVMGLADRVVVLDFGRVIASGAPAEVQRDPAVEAAYLGVPPTPGPPTSGTAAPGTPTPETPAPGTAVRA
ncbi:ABC transporter ATP-binding protein [Agromyces archimandritae]|uniref:ABC transporter ATP-binding protein n=1 Tax=Agromyces archimandritae TaxID=2781962 RepID=A0A975FQR2_9MICO|nr:ABC transporter ATP-binding protein [Agromyces archimandritae]QTX05983.1 ABC transporter ATP-binding protein [Agromyces archimandritae]